ncbi:hypothetical protein HK103_005573 [Boothiomyces macroporosus]|uniref:Uncharacterized protein n=1 Tax=Boothiomyces macroporosus TaxID=261099 RepID=A0AAD5UF25_9FUNG|nr:hypothetical protein HK103_005573 [Boothiomyces macroporosus]
MALVPHSNPTPLYNFQAPKSNTISYTNYSQNDIKTMVFISRIPDEMDDDDLMEILALCGTVKLWKRIKNADGTRTQFGFCTFADPMGVIRAMRTLVHEDYPFIVTCDNIAKEFLRTHPEFNSKKPDKAVLDKMKDLFEPIRNPEALKYMRQIGGDAPKLPPEPPAESLEVKHQEENEEEDNIQDLKRQEKREQERIFAFQEREKKFELNQVARIKRFQSDLEADQDYEVKRQKTRETLLEKWRNYDDDLEREKGEEEYYRDPQREIDYDNRDRSAEEEERAFAMAQERESAQRAEEERKRQEAEQAERRRHNRNQELHEQEQAKKFKITRIMTKEERVSAIQNLVSRIPVDREGIWQYPVKWQYLDNIIEKKLEGFLTKKINEYLGDTEKVLIRFIMKKIVGHAHVQEIYDELEKLLVEETEVFVLKLWRMVIYETEARHAGL